MRGRSRRRRWVVLGVPLVVAMLLLGAWGVMQSSAVHAAPVVNIRDIPVSGTLFNECGGEDVAFSGAFHIVIHSTSDGAGGLHSDITLNWHGVTGVGLTSGARYQMPEEHHSVENFNSENGFTASNSDNFRLIGQGPDNNQVVNFLFHLTITPDGTVTASFTDFRSVCH
jgi:hypothetical protein